MPSDPNKNQIAILRLIVEEDRFAAFLPLLAQGFTIKAKTGCSIKGLLCTQIGLKADYLEHRVQTIFLNGKAVDNINSAVVSHNSTLALSAAMPGLAGATLRRGGVYAAMRHQITHTKNAADEIIADGTVVLKLFNLVAADIGPMFLKQGICIDAKHLKNFFRKAAKHVWSGCRTAEIDGKPVKVEMLAHIDLQQQQIFFQLNTPEI